MGSDTSLPENPSASKGHSYKSAILAVCVGQRQREAPHFPILGRADQRTTQLIKRGIRIVLRDRYNEECFARIAEKFARECQVGRRGLGQFKSLSDIGSSSLAVHP